MCTVTVISGPVGNGFRVAMNRDVARDRPEAALPEWRSVGEDRSVRAIFPIDRPAGKREERAAAGTWIAANEYGLTLCLLNRAEGCDRPGAGRKSRGLVIPALVHHKRPSEAVGAFAGVVSGEFAPCRLLAVGFEPGADGRAAVRCHLAVWDGRRAWSGAPAHPPLCLASSGLGDGRVARRVALFNALAPSDAAGQDAFHAHAWPERPHLSVLMTRPDARTVSTTTISINRSGRTIRVEMAYRPVVEVGPAVVIRIGRAGAGV